MHRISPAIAALTLLTLAGCGDATPSARPTTAARQAPATATTPASTMPAAARPVPAPAPAPAEVTVTRDPPGPDYRSGGRTWRSCGTTVYQGGDDLYGISVSGPLDCDAGTDVMKALARQVQRRGAAATDSGTDCFPGYCYSGDPQPTTVAGYRCTATDHGDVSISLSILCRRGDRYVSAGAADDE